MPGSLVTKFNKLVQEYGIQECYMGNNGLQVNPKNNRSYYDTMLEPIKIKTTKYKRCGDIILSDSEKKELKESMNENTNKDMVEAI